MTVISLPSPEHTAAGRRLAWKVATLLDTEGLEQLLCQPELPVSTARCARRELSRRSAKRPVVVVSVAGLAS